MLKINRIEKKYRRAVRVKSKLARLFGGSGYPTSGVKKKGSLF